VAILKADKTYCAARADRAILKLKYGNPLILASFDSSVPTAPVRSCPDSPFSKFRKKIMKNIFVGNLSFTENAVRRPLTKRVRRQIGDQAAGAVTTAAAVSAVNAATIATE